MTNSPMRRPRCPVVLALAGFVLTSALAGSARAQPLRPGPDLPTPPPASPADGADSESPPPDRTPAEGRQSEQAAKQAKQAQLTPIVPDPQAVGRPAYQLFAETDLPLLGIGVVLASARLVRTQPAYCAPQCNPADLNALDRTTAGFWSVGWSTASDLSLYAIMGGSALTLLVDEGPAPALNDAVVVAESALTATGLASVVTLAAGRPRPFVFGDKAPLEQRNSADGGLSFLSSHTAVGFALVTSLFVTERRLHPGKLLPYAVLGAGLALASFVGTARVMAGKHFVTDAVGGAIVGTSVGVLVPALHGSPVKIAPTVTPREGSLNIVGTF